MKINIKFYLQITALFASILAASFIINKACWVYAPLLWQEWLIFFLIILGVVSFKNIRTFIADLPIPYKALIIILTFCFTVAQYIKLNQSTFPFVNLSMYSGIKSNHGEYFKYSGINQSGEIVPLDLTSILTENVANVVIIGSNRRLKNILKAGKDSLEKVIEEKKKSSNPKLKLLVRNFRNFMNPPESSIKDQMIMLNETLMSIGRIYNSYNPENPIQAVDISSGAYQILNMTSPVTITEKSVWRIHLKEKQGI